MNHYEEIARRKVRGAEDWSFCRFERVGNTGDVLLSGGVPRLITRGKNKGQPRWEGPLQTAVVTEQEFEAEKMRYEADTGLCAVCYGKGGVFKSWSAADGMEMQPCKRCDATGKKPEVKP